MFHNQRNRARRPVSRVLSRPCAYTWAGMAIPLGHPLPSASCNRPERQREGPAWHPKHAGVPAAPTWSCSRWGFPCRRRCRRRGALLPHHFTLAARGVSRTGRRYIFCGTFPGVAPAGRYPAPHLRGARTFLFPHAAESGHPAVWHHGIWGPPLCLSKADGSSDMSGSGIDEKSRSALCGEDRLL
jgi:hypothetical protein